MKVNRISISGYYSNTNVQYKPDVLSKQKYTNSYTAVSYMPYSNIVFRGKYVDNTNFRDDLKTHGEYSKTDLKLEGKDIEAGLYKTTHHEYLYLPQTDKFYKMRFTEDTERIEQQILASKLYNSVGIRTPEYLPFEKDGKTGYLVEVLEEKLLPAEKNLKAVYNSFIADVWLGNRNGLSKDNTKIDKNGNPVKLSVSGSLGYRASGKLKEKNLYYDIDEIYTMRDWNINPESANILSAMTDEELYDAIDNFKNNYDYNNNYKICKDKRIKGVSFEVENILSNRASNLVNFVKLDKENKLIQRRGFANGVPIWTNISHYDPTFSIDRGSILKITDEGWENLKKRDLLNAKSGLKKFGMSDYEYLSTMTDEEHENALKRNLYAHCKNDDTYYRINGFEIRGLSKLSDEEWKIVKDRNLLTAKLDHDINEFWLCDFINGVVHVDNYNWSNLINSHLLDTYCKAKDVNDFVDICNGMSKEESCEFQNRVRQLSNIEVDKRSIEKRYKAEHILKLAKLPKKNWERILEVTDNLKNVKMVSDELEDISNFDDEVYKNLQKRGLLQSAKRSYGLRELGSLTDNEWENVKKRKIDEKFPDQYDDWACLAALSDEQYKFAQDKGLFNSRGKNGWEGFDGKGIAQMVTTINEEGWKNIEKRQLLNNYYTSDFSSHYLVSANQICIIANYNDSDFAKYSELRKQSMDEATRYSLMKLNDVEFKRMYDRNLFQYINTYESLDDCSEDAPIITKLAQLTDEEYAQFVNQHNDCKTIAAKCLIIKANELGLNNKQSINELTMKEKRAYLQLLLSEGHMVTSKDFIENYNCSKLLPKTLEEYCRIIDKLVKSVGIDVKPLSDVENAQFLKAIDKISANNSEFSKLDLKNEKFKLNVRYPRKDFISDVNDIVNDLSQSEKLKVWDYFGFEISENKYGETIMSGYPTSLNNGEKLEEIENPQTKNVIMRLKPVVKEFAESNCILPDKLVSKNLADEFNDIFKGLPEIYSIIGKEQHSTHDYTLDVHTLNVLQGCINNPEFKTLSKTEKRTLILSALLHDISKEEKSRDKSHPKNSAYDAYYILQKLNLPKQERFNIYEIIKNHDILEQCNKTKFDYETKTNVPISEGEQNKLIKNYAYELRSDNNAELERILTKSDLLGVKRDGSFCKKFENVYEKVFKKLAVETKAIQKTAILLPQTRIPKASELIPDGNVVEDKITYDNEGNPIKNRVVNLSKNLDLSKYGFDKNTNTNNFNVLAHAFNGEINKATLEALNLVDKDALLSSSYIVYGKGNYHTFRQQGFIMNVLADDIGVAYYRDFGSGSKKSVESLINNYINGYCKNYRNYFSDLLKKEMNLSDDEYIDLYKKFKDKPINLIEQENPEVAEKFQKVFLDMEIHKRKFQRNYNEVLVNKGDFSAVFYEGKTNDGKTYTLEDVPEFLRKYAESHDLPIIYFGE